MSQQPLFEYAMADNLGAVGAPHMEVGVRLVEAKEAMLLQRLCVSVDELLENIKKSAENEKQVTFMREMN
jgi:predicted urease superfamily metal-dependent hydrolase